MVEPTINWSGSACVIFDGREFGRVPEEWFAASYWRDRDLVIDEVPGRGSTLIVRHGDEVWVLRHYRRGGVMAGFATDHYLWTGLERTRAFREWRLLKALFERGLPVPRPISGHVNREGMRYRANILTECIEKTRSWAAVINSGDARATHWCSIGRTLRRFHDEGVDHADLNAHNILIDDAEQVFLVDLDRGGLRGDGSWKKGNIKRLLRSLRKISLETGAVFDEAGWKRLLGSYESGR